MTPGPSATARAFAHLATVAVAAGVLSVRTFADDERAFPLSRYPMFAFHRPGQEPLPYVEVVLDDGSRRRLGFEWWTAGGVGTARNQLERLRSAPASRRLQFCRSLAGRVAASGEPWAARVERVTIQRGRFEARRVIHDGDATPVTTEELVSCEPTG